jgi:hypothetical protein
MEDFYRIPTMEAKHVALKYTNVSKEDPELSVILENTPKPKGRTSFSNIHFVAPTGGQLETVAEVQLESLKRQCDDVGKTFYVHRMNFVNAASNLGDPLWEFNAIFEVASELLMQGADRASLLLYVGPQDSKFDCFSAFVGMLPFRGVSVALLSQVSVWFCCFYAVAPVCSLFVFSPW